MNNTKLNITTELNTIDGSIVNPNKEEFFIESPYEQNLLEFRNKSYEYSLQSASARITKEKNKLTESNRILNFINTQLTEDNLYQYEYISCEYADDRGIKSIDVDFSENYIVTAGVSAICKIFHLDVIESDNDNNMYMSFMNDKFSLSSSLIGHKEKVNSVKFNKTAKFNTSYAPHIATASDDKTIKLWSFDVGNCNKNNEGSLLYQKSTTLSGHESKVNDIEFTRINYYLGSVSDDKTIRFWDLVTKKNFLIQEGHIEPITNISFQPDGALYCTGDLSGIGLVWDIRTGKKIMNLEGHTSHIYSIAFNPNSYQIATSAADNTIRVWDLRKNGRFSIIPSGKKPVKSLYYDEDILVSGSFDGSLRIWNSAEHYLIKDYKVDDSIITSVKFAKKKKYLITSSTNRTLKLLKRK